MALVLSGLGLLAGCREPDPIHEYVVARPPVPGSLWFFKLLGPTAAVEPYSAPLKAFVESVTFDARGLPQWKLPEGWKEEASNNPVRYKTIHLPGEGGLEIAVTQVATRVPPPSETIAAQARLLREQVGLPASQDDGHEELGSTSTPGRAGEHAAWFFDYSGQTSRFGPTRLLAGMVAVPIPPVPAAAPASESETLPFTYMQPEEWREAPQTGFSVVSLASGEGDDLVKMTISPTGGGVFVNVNRWRQQAGLAPLMEDQFVEHVQEIELPGKTLLYVEEIGAERGILGGILTVGSSTYYIKLDGKPAAVERERERFRKFLESIRLRT